MSDYKSPRFELLVDGDEAIDCRAGLAGPTAIFTESREGCGLPCDAGNDDDHGAGCSDLKSDELDRKRKDNLESFGFRMNRDSQCAFGFLDAVNESAAGGAQFALGITV